MHNPEALFVAVAFTVVHLASSRVANMVGNAHGFASFSGGLAVSYVFLHLIPELAEGHEVVGRRIYFVALVGFTVLYGIEYWIRHRRTAEVSSPTAHYALHMSVSALYTGLLVFTLGTQLPPTIPLTIVFVISIGLHLLSGDVGSMGDFGDRFRTQGRFILAGAALAGYALSMVRRPREVVVDILTAMLAGFMLFNVFKEELPNIGKARIRPFLAGVATFFVLHLVLVSGTEKAEPPENEKESSLRPVPVQPSRSIR